MTLGSAGRPARQQPDPAEQVWRFNNRGIALLEQYEYRLAAEEFQNALQVNRGSVPALVNLGIALYYGADLDRAERQFRTALSLSPDLPQGHYMLGLVLSQDSARIEEALSEFRKVGAAHPDDPGTIYNIGICLMRDRQFEQAIAQFENVLRLDPRHVSALWNMATSYIRAGRREEGKKALERLKELVGEEQSGGAIAPRYYEEGRFALAMSDYELPGAAAELRDPEVRFVEATAAAGIRFSHGGPEVPSATLLPRELAGPSLSAGWVVRNVVPRLGSGAAFLDYNLDERPDIYLVNCSADGKAANALYRNNGDGTFRDVTRESGTGVSALGMGAAAGDFDNDGYPDLYLTNYGGNILLRNGGDGTFKDVTAQAGVGGSATQWSLSAAFVDYDHDGDLDLYVCNLADLGKMSGKRQLRFPDALPAQANRLYRNNGDGTFIDVADVAKVAATSGFSAGIAFTDFNESRDIDLLLTTLTGHVRLFSNNRNGSFTDVSASTGLAAAGAGPVAVADFDRDGFTDLFFARPGTSGGVWMRNNAGRSFSPAGAEGAAQATGDRVWAAGVLDYDNDGWLDVLTVATGVRLLRNESGGRFSDVSGPAGLAGIRIPAARSAAIADYDGDGDPDVLVTGCGMRPVLLRNDGGSRNNFVRVHLDPQKDNRSAFGAKLEIRSGGLRQKLEVNGGCGYLSQGSADILLGLGRRTAVDAIRVLWPTGVLQSEIDPPANTSVKIAQLDRKGTSCPILYAWDGTQYGFVTDFLGGGAVGSLLSPGRYNAPDPDEYIRVTSSQLKPRHGVYSLKMNDQLEEVIFLDQARLLAVDHPADVEVFPNERLMPGPPFPRFRIFTVRKPRQPLRATDERGNDILPLLREADRRYSEGFRLLPFKGYAEPHSIVLDFGDLSGAKKAILLLTGWIDYADSTSNLAAYQAGLRLMPPRLEMMGAGGRWETVLDSMGFPAGLPKTMTVDLTGRLVNPERCRIRIVTNLRIYWDQIVLDTSPDGVPLRTTALPLKGATLGWGGYPREWSPDGRRPFLYDYSRREASAPWKSHAGRYTRYGDVTELVAGRDNQYVVMRHGDEAMISFDGRSLAALPEGWTRTFLVYAAGFGKDMDLNSLDPDTVEPFPFDGAVWGSAIGSMPPQARALTERVNTRSFPAPIFAFAGLPADTGP